MYDLKQAMRALCPEAAEVVKRCLHSKDEKIVRIPGIADRCSD